ncbi:phage protein [Streptococcus pyogenes]|nr:phage protein [Streptococcus pyogenes]SQG28522.1 phage protein [Streptococcus pyogenes]SQG40580.1 phage protein [Streptococcus pyogenes]SUO77139.1 phage protein [Streptococcus pyogenes]VGR38059.1 phage protein [Streptococcus pyogenes]
MSKWELQKLLLANATDFESTVEALFELNELGEISDEELLLNLRTSYRKYSEEKLRGKTSYY